MYIEWLFFLSIFYALKLFFQQAKFWTMSRIFSDYVILKISFFVRYDNIKVSEICSEMYMQTLELDRWLKDVVTYFFLFFDLSETSSAGVMER